MLITPPKEKETKKQPTKSLLQMDRVMIVKMKKTAGKSLADYAKIIKK